jgi:pyruvate formate lyase activating enzyme
VIERVHYEIGAHRIRDGACTTCGTIIPGVFEDTCGDWGRKRLPVDLRSFHEK